MPFTWIPNNPEPLLPLTSEQQVIPETASIYAWWKIKDGIMPTYPGFHSGNWHDTRCLTRTITVDCTISTEKPPVKPGPKPKGTKPAKGTNTGNKVAKITKPGPKPKGTKPAKSTKPAKDKCYIPIKTPVQFQVAFCGEALLYYAQTFRKEMADKDDPGEGLEKEVKDFMGQQPGQLIDHSGTPAGVQGGESSVIPSRALAGQNPKNVNEWWPDKISRSNPTILGYHIGFLEADGKCGVSGTMSRDRPTCTVTRRVQVGSIAREKCYIPLIVVATTPNQAASFSGNAFEDYMTMFRTSMFIKYEHKGLVPGLEKVKEEVRTYARFVENQLEHLEQFGEPTIEYWGEFEKEKEENL